MAGFCGPIIAVANALHIRMHNARNVVDTLCRNFLNGNGLASWLGNGQPAPAWGAKLANPDQSRGPSESRHRISFFNRNILTMTTKIAYTTVKN